MKLPEQLKNKEFRFVLLPKNAKSPPIHSFNEKQFTWQEAELHDGNIAVLGGYGGLGVLDIDDIDFLEAIIDKIPNTFTVKTATKKLPHFYFIIEEDI